ncbi:MAG: hydantoinase/oxoprolinase N-terminal domain-containing protein [Desulfopila sp.]
MAHYLIGIDTGGTFTDAVLIEEETARIIASVKKPTTHQQLARGTIAALTALLAETGVAPGTIRTVGVSSTLATNAVVENKGARVALLVIGYVRHFRLPVTAVIYIQGGHRITGEEEQPLDLEYLVEIVNNLKGEVDAYGVCSAMSIKNPTHELVVEEAITMIDPKPVFCSFRASGAAGMKERAATAGLHAKLMPVMQEYLQAIAEAMAKLQLRCPVQVIGGNGRPISSDRAMEFAGATVASGPACTARFGALHTTGDALVIDVGGTTTDIAMIRNGAPLLAPEGCRIGGWQTHVEAVNMITAGIGGDSHARIDDRGKIVVGPARVVPLAMAGAIPEISSWLGGGEQAKLIVGYQEGLTGQDDEIARFLQRHGPATLQRIKEGTGLAGVPLEKRLERMTSRQRVYECGFTPTDALHVLGQIALGDRAAAQTGAEILGSLLGLTGLEFSRRVIAATEKKIENLLIDYVIQQYWGNSLTSFLAERTAHPVLGVNFSLKIPLIGIGAAAQSLLPAVAARLGTTIHFPEHCEIGSAIGAAMICRDHPGV